MGSLRYLVFSASLRSGSLNTAIANLAGEVIKANGDVDLGSMSDFDTTSFDADVEQADGLPPGAEALRQRLEMCVAFVIASPEHNASVPGLLKNLIDWVSRYRPQPFNERHCLLLSASPSMVGGNRGLWALRSRSKHLGARVYPDMFSLAQAHNATASSRAPVLKAHRRGVFNECSYLRELRKSGDDQTRRHRFMAAETTVDGIALQVVELTGQPGDVVFIHPWLVHAVAPNAADGPRFMRAPVFGRYPE